MSLASSPQELGARIREERKAQGLSQRALAAKAGCSQRFVSELERGKTTAELGKTFDVLRALNMRIDVLAGRGAVDDFVQRFEAQLTASEARPTSLSHFLGRA